jgi:hypothetical protein
VLAAIFAESAFDMAAWCAGGTALGAVAADA